jgi:DNA-binding response OmpR family regulator
VKKRILLVEDSRDFRDALTATLEAQGFAVTQAADGVEALALAKADTPDLVVLDIALPRLDGFYVAEVWKRDPSMAKVPVSPCRRTRRAITSSVRSVPVAQQRSESLARPPR